MTRAVPIRTRTAPAVFAQSGPVAAKSQTTIGAQNAVQPNSKAAAATRNVAPLPPRISVPFFEKPSHNSPRRRYIRVAASLSAAPTPILKPPRLSRRQRPVLADFRTHRGV